MNTIEYIKSFGYTDDEISKANINETLDLQNGIIRVRFNGRLLNPPDYSKLSYKELADKVLQLEERYFV